MRGDTDESAEDARLRAFGDRLARDPAFQADADAEFAALVLYARAMLAVGDPGSARPDSAPP